MGALRRPSEGRREEVGGTQTQGGRCSQLPRGPGIPRTPTSNAANPRSSYHGCPIRRQNITLGSGVPYIYRKMVLLPWVRAREKGGCVQRGSARGTRTLAKGTKRGLVCPCSYIWL